MCWPCCFRYVQEDALAQMSQPLPLSLKLFAAFRLAVVYPFFLYANFSGYIDIVIALARLMRVRLPENFDRPFSASSFLDFWNRWHITLSTWLKTYVYNPLLVALMRRIPSLACEPLPRCLLLLRDVLSDRCLARAHLGVRYLRRVARRRGPINKLWQLGLTRAVGRKGYKALAKNSFYIAFGRGLTFSWFAFTLFWFWANWKQIDTSLFSPGRGSIGLASGWRLAVRDSGAGGVGMAARATAVDQGYRGTGAHQPLCARGLCVRAGSGRLCHDRLSTNLLPISSIRHFRA